MKNYGVLKGKAVKFYRDDDSTPHSELLMRVGEELFRIAINVRSSRGPTHQRLVEYLIKHDLNHPLLGHARQLTMGWHNLKDGVDDDAAIDYIRSNIFRASEMKPITHLQPGPQNDLFEYVEDLLQRAISEEGAVIYAFGERWGPENGKPDQYFGFTPGNGVHMIHMNQGGRGDGNRTYQDGALVFDFPGSKTTSALFIKFQNQVWHTDETDGSPIANAPRVPIVEIPARGGVEPWEVVAADSPYRLARIVAAMVNPGGHDPGHESVTVLNISEQSLNLAGWKILDQNDLADTIDSGSLEPGEAKVFRLDGKGAQLSNKGGTITLLDAQGLKVDGVAYTAAEASREARPVAFV